MPNLSVRIIFISFVCIVIGLVEYSIYRSFIDILAVPHSYFARSFIISFFLAPVLLLVSALHGFKRFTKVGSLIYTISVVWLGAMIYIFMCGIVLALFRNTDLFIKSGLTTQYLLQYVLFALAGIIVIWGIWNANTPRIVTWKIESGALGPKWAGKKIVLLSDTHFGQVRREKFARKLTRLINEQKPDIVFHAGDIIDGPSLPYKRSFDHLESITPPLGFVYVEGNHERYSREYDIFRSFFPKSITDATDTKLIINDTQVIGLSFKEPESKEGIQKRLLDLKYDKALPSIILLHDPKHSEALADLGVSLVLSGHTHGGQFFPSSLIVKNIYKSFAHGVVKRKNTTHVTTYGVGTALVPMRIGTVPEIVILDIQ